MKVLHIGKHFAPFSGGVENYHRDAMIALAGHGVESAALVHQHKFSLKGSEETLEVDGMKLPVVKTATWFKLLFTPISPGFPWRLSRLIKSFKPDVLHLHMPNPSAFWALFLPAARRLPWVIHWHADVITEQQDWKMKFFYQIYKRFEYAVLKRSAAIIATSPPYLASSVPLQPWLKKCHVVPLAMDTSRLADMVGTTAAPPESTPSLQVLAIGRLTYYKGFQFLIKAAALVPEVQIQLVGTGDQQQTLTALATSLNVMERVTFHGTLDDRQLAAQLAKCDCICLPSIERTEAFGMVLLEAQSFARATVVSDVPGSGMGWVVDDHDTGLTVPPANAGALAKALKWLHENRDALHTMGQNGRRKFEQEFEINKTIVNLISVYQEALKTGEPLD